MKYLLFAVLTSLLSTTATGAATEAEITDLGVAGWVEGVSATDRGICIGVRVGGNPSPVKYLVIANDGKMTSITADENVTLDGFGGNEGFKTVQPIAAITDGTPVGMATVPPGVMRAYAGTSGKQAWLPGPRSSDVPADVKGVGASVVRRVKGSKVVGFWVVVMNSGDSFEAPCIWSHKGQWTCKLLFNSQETASQYPGLELLDIGDEDLCVGSFGPEGNKTPCLVMQLPDTSEASLVPLPRQCSGGEELVTAKATAISTTCVAGWGRTAKTGVAVTWRFGNDQRFQATAVHIKGGDVLSVVGFLGEDIVVNVKAQDKSSIWLVTPDWNSRQVATGKYSNVVARGVVGDAIVATARGDALILIRNPPEASSAKKRE